MAMIQRTAEAIWQGNLQNGAGKVSTGSGAIREQPYTWRMRFENEPGTNPEELIAAAHAACFTMALAATLSKAGYVPDSLRTHALLTMEQENGRWSATRIQLKVEGQVPTIEPNKFRQYANEAKDNCPISRLLKPGLKEIEIIASLVP